jgi:hypothetical protein
MRKLANLKISFQPTETSCGATCLHAIYRHYGDPIGLDEVIKGVSTLGDGGTLAVLLACHALQRGYRAQLYTYNLEMFDPSWFHSPVADLSKKLKAQQARKKSRKIKVATAAYIKFLKMGGKVRFKPLNPKLIINFMKAETPILTGLSATYLYHCARENQQTNLPDDIGGTPTGHFVVIHGYREKSRLVRIADPFPSNPFSSNQKYSIPLDRLIGAILLGIITYDANILVITPKH